MAVYKGRPVQGGGMFARTALLITLIISLGCGNTATERVEVVVPSRVGMVSLTFDDGYESAYRLALPILNKYGLKATWYIINNRAGPAYMTKDKLLALQAQGQEIGGHTRNHFPLDTVSDAVALAEVQGGRLDLLALGVTEVRTFAYPFGRYNARTQEVVLAAGFTTARTVDGELQNDLSTKATLLHAWSIVPATQLGQITSAIDKAVRDQSWFIIVIHRVDEDGNSISVRHELIEGVASYLVTRKVKVVTISEGFRLLR